MPKAIETLTVKDTRASAASVTTEERESNNAAQQITMGVSRHPPRKTKKYLNSLTYTIARLNGECESSESSSSSSDSTSESTAEHDGGVEESKSDQESRPSGFADALVVEISTNLERIPPDLEASPHSGDEEEDLSEMFAQMRAMGLPTSFGSSVSKSRRKNTANR